MSKLRLTDCKRLLGVFFIALTLGLTTACSSNSSSGSSSSNALPEPSVNCGGSNCME